MCLLCLLGGGEDCNNDMIGLVFGCYADELKVGDCVSVLCCAEVRCAHCALWWMQLREGGWWRRLPTAGPPPPSTQSVLSEAPDWGHQQGDHHPSLMCCVLYSCERFWRSINKVFSFQIQYILYSPIMMIKLSSLYLYFSFTWHHACEMFISLYANRYSKLMSQWMRLPFNAEKLSRALWWLCCVCIVYCAPNTDQQPLIL